jgi:hypothetical protein
MRLDQKFIVCAAVSCSIGLASSTGSPVGIAITGFAPVLWIAQNSRRKAFIATASYYAGAIWPVILAVRNFFGPNAGVAKGIGIWLAAIVLLALPWLWLWTTDCRQFLWRTPASILLTVVPPLGLIGWASPLIAAGYLFPGTEWLGLSLILLLPALLTLFPEATLALVMALVLLTHAIYPGDPDPPKDWEAVNTNFGGIAHEKTDFLQDYHVAQEIQTRALHSTAHVIVFPESVITNWTDAREMFWSQTLAALRASGKTILVGATLPLNSPGYFASNQHRQFDFATGLAVLRNPEITDENPRINATLQTEARELQYQDAILARGAQPGLFLQRIPVPIGMWKPLSRVGVPLHLGGSGIATIAGQRAAILICYEQLLIWPVLVSMLDHPTMIVAIANDYWVKTTTIPKFQRAAVRFWAWLFGIPYVLVCCF